MTANNRMKKCLRTLVNDRGQYRITLPKHLVEEMGFKRGDVMQISKLTKYTLAIRRLNDKRYKKWDIKTS